MELWIPITIGAALAQTVRFMLQKVLASGTLSAGGATLARFLYSAPLVALFLWAYVRWTAQPLPELLPRFWAYALLGGLAQILATMAVVALFSYRNFAVGMTFKKTEVMLTALVGFAILGDRVSVVGLAAILIGFAGVLGLSGTPALAGQVAGSIFNRSAGIGLLSGFFFAISAVGYRGAVLSVQSSDLVLKAGLTLAIVTAFQTVALGAWLAWREDGQIIAVLRAWRTSGLVGIFSMLGSFGWFSAFALQSAAYVFALGQIELLFSLLAAVLFFHERIASRELWGMALLTGSIVVLVSAA